MVFADSDTTYVDNLHLVALDEGLLAGSEVSEVPDGHGLVRGDIGTYLR